ncbi:MAG: hypothetical protein DMG06_27180 [Acidobacteria bacterium]|nr:MAG: hypothetical protein DMG06_27180 [Acidobacteriota bacterium]
MENDKWKMEIGKSPPLRRWTHISFRLPEGPLFRRPVAEKAYSVICGETGILFSFSQLTPLTPTLSPPVCGERENTGNRAQTQGSAGAPPWATHISPLTGLGQNTEPFWLLTPDS